MKIYLKSISLSVLLIALIPLCSAAQDCPEMGGGELCDTGPSFVDVESVSKIAFGLTLGTDDRTTGILTEILDASPQHAAVILRYLVAPDELPPLRMESRMGLGDAPEDDSLKNAMRSMILAGDYPAALTLYEEFHDSGSELIVVKEAVLVEIVAGHSEPEPRFVVATWFDAADLLTENRNPDIQTILKLDVTEQSGLFQVASASSYIN